MYGEIKAVARDVTKLALNGSPYWRLMVTATLLVLCFLVYSGYQNFALADSVDQKIASAISPLQQDLDGIKKRQDKAALRDLTESLLNAKRNQCEATRGNRNARGWTERIKQLMDDYYALTKTPFDMPLCNEV